MDDQPERKTMALDMRSCIDRIIEIMAKPKRFTDQLREALEKSEVTRYRIAADTKIDQASLSRFMSGITGLTTENIDKLCEYLNLRLVADKPSRRSNKTIPKKRSR